MKRAEFLERMEKAENHIMLWNNYNRYRGMCEAVKNRANLKGAFTLMKEVYFGGRNGHIFYFPLDDGQHVRLIAFYLLQEYILSEKLYREW